MTTTLLAQMLSRFSIRSIPIQSKKTMSDLGQALMAPNRCRTAITNMQVLPLMSISIFPMIMKYQTLMVNPIKIWMRVMSLLHLYQLTTKLLQNQKIKGYILVKAHHSNILPPPSSRENHKKIIFPEMMQT